MSLSLKNLSFKMAEDRLCEVVSRVLKASRRPLNSDEIFATLQMTPGTEEILKGVTADRFRAVLRGRRCHTKDRGLFCLLHKEVMEAASIDLRFPSGDLETHLAQAVKEVIPINPPRETLQSVSSLKFDFRAITPDGNINDLTLHANSGAQDSVFQAPVLLTLEEVETACKSAFVVAAPALFTYLVSECTPGHLCVSFALREDSSERGTKHNHLALVQAGAFYAAGEVEVLPTGVILVNGLSGSVQMQILDEQPGRFKELPLPLATQRLPAFAMARFFGFTKVIFPANDEVEGAVMASGHGTVVYNETVPLFDKHPTAPRLFNSVDLERAAKRFPEATVTAKGGLSWKDTEAKLKVARGLVGVWTKRLAGEAGVGRLADAKRANHARQRERHLRTVAGLSTPRKIGGMPYPISVGEAARILRFS